MHLKSQRPVFVPELYFRELEKLSKATWMDIAWDLATRCSGGDDLNGPKIMEELQDTIRIVTAYRKQAKP